MSERDYKTARAVVDFLAVLVVVLLAFVVFMVANAHSAVRPAPPLHRQFNYMASGCFHVAPRQFICPLPAPKRFSSNVGGGGGWPACSATTNGWYFWSGYRWWLCGFNPHYGWIWVPV